MSFKKQLFLICGVLAVPFLGLQADDVNVALRKPVTASSQQEKFPASNVTDGVISRKSTWMSAESARPPHMLDINLERYYDINKIVIYTIYSMRNIFIIIFIGNNIPYFNSPFFYTH